jgi:hypothetical protein
VLTSLIRPRNSPCWFEPTWTLDPELEFDFEMKMQTLTCILAVSLFLVLYSCAPPTALTTPAVRPHHPPLCLGLEEELYRQMVHGPTGYLYRNEAGFFRSEGGLGEKWDQRGVLE